MLGDCANTQDSKWTGRRELASQVRAPDIASQPIRFSIECRRCCEKVMQNTREWIHFTSKKNLEGIEKHGAVKLSGNTSDFYVAC